MENPSNSSQPVTERLKMDINEFNIYFTKAFYGSLIFDSFSPVEYKCLARAYFVGVDHRAGRLSEAEAQSRLSEYYSEYQRDRERQNLLEKYNKAWCDSIKTTDTLRVLINGESDPVKIAALACRAVYCMTNDIFIQAKAQEMERRIE